MAILAAVSTAVMAKELKQSKNASPSTVATVQMSDAEMDKVVAGATPTPGQGLITASEANGKGSSWFMSLPPQAQQHGLGR
jgi:hypothetical protein